MRSNRQQRFRRHRRVRKKILGTEERPRLAVFRSHRHFYAQLIDDIAGSTLVAASTLEPDVRSSLKGQSSEAAEKVGELIAERAKGKGIDAAVFDRGGFRYHGKIKNLADAARKGGLSF